MDWRVLLDVTVSLLWLVLQMVDGFSLSGMNSDQLQASREDDGDVQQIRRNIQYLRSLRHSRRHLHEQSSDLPADVATLLRAISHFSSEHFSPSPSSSVREDKSQFENFDGKSSDNLVDDDIDVMAAFSVPSNADPDTDDVISSSPEDEELQRTPSKRQQGWYATYGKRTASDEVFQNKPLTSLANSGILNSPERASVEIFSPSSRLVGLSDADWLQNIRLYLDMGEHLNQMETGDPVMRDIMLKLSQLRKDQANSNGKDSGLMQRSPEKRQQGWHTQYGKRSRNVSNSKFS